MGRVVGIDSSIFVYLIEDHPRFADAAERYLRKVQEGIETAVFSRVGMIELLTGSKKQGRSELTKKYQDYIAHLPHLTLMGLTNDIVEIASDLRAKYGLRTPDAIHLASAIAADADTFLTNDRNLKKVKDIKVELLRSR